MPIEDLDDLLGNFKAVAEGTAVPRSVGDFNTYAISNFRGGIGKTTLAFNLAYELSRKHRSLFIDACPQRNFTQNFLDDETLEPEFTIYDAILPYIVAGATTIEPEDLLMSVARNCTPFKGGRKSWFIPGSKELFLFPSVLYTQINTNATLGARSADINRRTLQALESTIKEFSSETSKTLIDTSPFFGGATHLSWVAADALVIPVRVDQHSIEALKLTLSMLKNPEMDFLRMNKQAGIKKVPKVHAIAMTHCGWSRQSSFAPDRSTQAYLKQVIDIVQENAELFSCADNPVEAVHLLDEFHSAGRISGSKRIPLARLNVGQSYVIEGQRLEVNPSLERYNKELKYLASSLVAHEDPLDDI